MKYKANCFPGKIFFLLLVLFVFFAANNLCAQTEDSGPPADNLVFKIAVIGPGDELYFWWGHIGLIIEDRAAGESRFYDWGIFSFENENFFANFALGRLLYTCGASLPEWNLEHYVNTNRDITLYTLDLPAAKKEELKRYAEWTILPENKDYYYHHFRDNCATRIRDIIDMALDGEFKEKYGGAEGRFTLREHVRRHTWFNPFFDWLLSFLMGRGIDQPITVWDEMFLPSEIAARIGEFVYAAPDGTERKLVAGVEILNRAVNRPAVLAAPRRQWPFELAAGCVLALVFALLLFLRRKERAREKSIPGKIWALGQGGLGLFFGGAGTVLFFMMFFTNHDYTYRNINIFFANPLLIASFVFGIQYCRAASSNDLARWEKAIKTLWSAVFGLGIISVFVNLLPFFGQKNLVDLALVLPPAAVLSRLPDFFGKKAARG